MHHSSLPGLVAAVLLGLVATPALAQEPEAPRISAEQWAKLNPTLDLFFSRLQAGDVEAAYDGLIGDTPMPNRASVMPTMIAQSQSMLSLYEGVLRWEAVDDECLIETVCRVRYVVHTAQLPVFFTFDVYRAPSGWKVTSITFTDLASRVY